MYAATTQVLSANSIMPSFWSIALHFLNFAILTLVLYKFIYKPVKRGIEKRQAEAKAALEENAALTAEVEKMQAENREMHEKAREDALAVHQQVLEAANLTSEEIVAKAHHQAKLILEEAKKESAHIKESLKEDMRFEIAHVSAAVASSILGREITAADNDAFIEKCIDSWDENE